MIIIDFNIIWNSEPLFSVYFRFTEEGEDDLKYKCERKKEWPLTSLVVAVYISTSHVGEWEVLQGCRLKELCP